MHALQIDTLVRHMSRDEQAHPKTDYLCEKLGLSKSTVSGAMHLLIETGRYEVMGHKRRPLQIMPQRAEEIGRWPEGKLCFVPMPEATIWLPAVDLTLVTWLARWAEVCSSGKRKDVQPLSVEVDPEALEDFGRERLAAGLARLVGWDFVRRERGALYLTPKAAQESFKASRPEGELPLHRLARKVRRCRMDVPPVNTATANFDAATANFYTDVTE